jgi:hypothetical protein
MRGRRNVLRVVLTLASSTGTALLAGVRRWSRIWRTPTASKGGVAAVAAAAGGKGTDSNEASHRSGSRVDLGGVGGIS